MDNQLVLIFQTILSVTIQQNGFFVCGNKIDPFRVIWNSRIEECQPTFGVKINLTRWGIERNTPPYNGWYGDVLHLTNGDFGEWPAIDNKGNIHNGGVPQKMDLNKHLHKVANYLQSNISQDWKGVGVLDFEGWWPRFEDNMNNVLFKRYCNYSMHLVRQAFPTWNETQVYNQAALEFDSAARVAWTATLELAKYLRPGRGWAYYRFPICIGRKADNLTCPNQFHNDRLAWLWETSDFLYPSIYFYGLPHKWERGHRQAVFSLISETLRCRNKVDRPDLPILAYTKFYTQTTPLLIYDTIDLINSIGLLGDMGVEGTIMWGDKMGEVNKTRCLETKEYMDNVLGPLVFEVKKFESHCSETQCSSHGRCYMAEVPMLKNLNKGFEEFDIMNAVRKSNLTSRFNQIDIARLGYFLVKDYKKTHSTEMVNMNMYKCRCFNGYTGSSCEHQQVTKN